MAAKKSSGGSKSSEKVKERHATGIPGFDRLCEGGFYKHSVNLVVGSPGAGKTTFLLQFLHYGATKDGENGLYVSFEPEIEDLYIAGEKQGMDFRALDKANKVKIIKMSTSGSALAMASKLKGLIHKYKAQRICLDPLNDFVLYLPKGKNARSQMYDMANSLKQLGVLVVLSGEANEETVGVQNLPEEITFAKFFADSVVELYASGLGGAGDRAIRISKMRMTKNVRGPQSMEITDKGLKVL